MHFEKIEEYSFDHGFHFNPNTGEYHSLNPHDLGRPLTHTEMDYNLLYQKQTLNGWRIAGSNTDLTLNSTDLNKVLAYKQITQSDSEWSRYNAAGLFAGQLVWVPVEIGTVAPTTTTTTIPPTTTTTTTQAPTTTTSTTTTSTTTTLAPQYISLTASPQPSVDEGAQIQFNLTTQNVLDGTTVGWTITGVDGSDISGGLTGTFTINSNAAIYLISVSEDLVTEGTETLTLTLNATDNAGTAAGLSDSIDINDTSLTPTTTTTTSTTTTSTTTQAPTTTTSTTTTTQAPTTTTSTTTQAPTTTTSTTSTTTQAPQYISLTVDPRPSVDEGAQIQFDLTTQNVLDGTTVGWTITGVDDNDISGRLIGTFTINSNAVQYLISVSEDLATEGTETLTLTLNTVDSAGTTAGLSASIDINDTSLTPTTTTSTTSTTTSTTTTSTTTTTQAPTTTTSTTSTTTTTLPEFTCNAANVVINDGAVGDSVVAQVDEGTISGIIPSTYQLGSTSYTVAIIIPSGYNNAGGVLDCIINATGTTTTTTTSTTTTTTSTTTTTLPEFDCDTPGLSLSLVDGPAGSTAAVTGTYWPSGTVGAGTPVALWENSTTPNTYQEGLTTYIVNFIVPNGFNNSGQNIECSVDAIGTTTTTSTTTSTTTTSTTTTSTTTTLAPLSTGFYFHLGIGGYPYTQDLINGTWYKQNNSVAANFADGFADALANSSSYETISVITAPLVDGSQWTYPTSVAQNFYWLLIPDSWNIPDLTAASKLADTQNNIPGVANAKLATTVYGEPYTLYKINLLSTTQGVTIKYVD